MSSVESGTELATTVILGIVGVAALILSIINFYFEQIKGAKVRAFAWEVSHVQQVSGKRVTSGKFAFTNEGNRSAIVTAVLLRLSTGEKYPMQITPSIGQKGFPMPLPPQQTEFRLLVVDYPKPDKKPECHFEFEMYPKGTGVVEYNPQSE
jgi:hypothetical protein